MMTYHAQHRFGQAGGAVRAAPATLDKWHLIDALADAGERFGIGHRQIAVLKALASFHPQRAWPVTADKLIVYPSNKTLSARLGGMPESTLRRHLATLIRAGLLERHASSNGKRFRRGRGAAEVAFGIDLAPLVHRAQAIRTARQASEDAAEKRAALRAVVLSLRQELIVRAGEACAAFLQDVRRALRRRLDLETLETMVTALRARLSAVTATARMSARDSQNERHKDTQERKNNQEAEEGGPDVTPALIDHLCPERRIYFPQPLRRWAEVIDDAEKIAPMLGLSAASLGHVRQHQGPLGAAIAVLYLLERSDKVASPSAYLRRLASLPDMIGTVISALQSQELSADNTQNNCISMA